MSVAPATHHLATSDGRVARRQLAIKAQHFAPKGDRLRSCGNPLGQRIRLIRGTESGAAGFGGILLCGRGLHCPVCAAKVGAHRSAEIAEAVRIWQDAGNSLTFNTLTMRHNAGHSLRDLRKAVSYAWKSTVSGRWKAVREQHQIDGYIRVFEVTHGVNGWHVHVHFLMFHQGQTADTHGRAVADWMFTRWANALRRKGFDALRSHGVDSKVVTGPSDQALGQYLGKLASAATNVAMELGSSATKLGHLGSRSPWQILRDAVSGDAVSQRLWVEWLDSTKGWKTIFWQRGFRDQLGLLAELTDEQIVAEDHDAEVIAQIDRDGYRELLDDPPLLAWVFAAIDAGAGIGDLAQILAGTGINLYAPAPPPPPSQSN